MVLNYQYEITITDQGSKRVYPKIYATRSQIGPINYASKCMENKIKWIQGRAKAGNRNIFIETELIPVN